MEMIYILTTTGAHTVSTKDQFVSGLTAKGAKVEFTPSRRGAFDIIKVNGHAVAKAFFSEAALIAAFADGKKVNLFS